jgi:TolB-like protein/tetratricopeptide (TPR) repeat protein
MADETAADRPVGLPDRSDPLLGWKAIARHLRVSVRTAQRWASTEAMPVHRHMHGAMGSPYAYGSELDSWWQSRPASRQAPPVAGSVQSIAVLPFADLDRELATEVLADGLTEELINALAHVESLQVVARTSVFHFKSRPRDVREIAARLGVDVLLEGSVRCAGGRVRVTAQLVDGRSGCHLWSDRFDHQRGDLLALQENLAHAIAGTLRISLGDRSASPPVQRGGSVEAYERYLEGRFHWMRRTPAGFLKAVECFERALKEDPQLAVAWAALAECYAMAQGFSTPPPQATIGRATSAAERALALDPGLAAAHVTLGFLRAVYAFDWAGAEGHFLCALKLAPDDAFAHLLYGGVVLAPTGRLTEADEHQSRAAALDPLSAVVVNATGMVRLMQRRYEEAAAAFRSALALDESYPWAHRGLGEVYLLQGQYRESLRAIARVEMPAFGAGFAGYCQAKLGQTETAELVLRRLEHLQQAPVSYQIAVLRLGLGDLDGTFEWLGRAAAHRSIGVLWLKVDPIWDPLRSEPRFASVLATMGLDPGAPD